MMLIFKVFVTLPLQFNDNNIKKKPKTFSAEQNCLHSGEFVFTPFMPVFVMYHSQTRSPKMDQVWPAESDLNVLPKLEVSKSREPQTEHEGSDLNSA